MPRRRPDQVRLDRFHEHSRTSYVGVGFSARGLRRLVLLERDRPNLGPLPTVVRRLRAQLQDPAWRSPKPYDGPCPCCREEARDRTQDLMAYEAVLDRRDRQVLDRLIHRGGVV